MLKRLSLFGLGAIASGALFATLGPTKAVAAFIGAGVVLAMFEWPIVGLVLVILCGSCLQVIGDSHLTGLPFSLGKLCGGLAMVMWFLKFVRDRIPCTYSPQMLALLAYLAAMVVNVLLVTPIEAAAESWLMRFLQVVVVYWLAANLAGVDRRSLLIGVASLSAGVALCGVIGLCEHFLPSLALTSDDPSVALGAIGAIVDSESLEGYAIKRITGGLGDSNWLAAYLAAVLPLNIFWWRRVNGLGPRSLVALCAALQMLALVLSYTRAGFVALAFAVLYLVWKRIITLAPLLMAGVAAVLIGIVWLPSGFLERMFSVQYLEQGSTPMRSDLTGTALRFALERPLLGYGYGQFGVEFMQRINTDLTTSVGAYGFELARAVRDGREQAQDIGTHNLILEVMVEYGLLGLVPFLTFMGLVLYDLRLCERWGDEEQRLLAICLAAGVIALYVDCMFVHAKYLKIVWFMAGLAAAQRRVALSREPVTALPLALAPGRAPA